MTGTVTIQDLTRLSRLPDNSDNLAELIAGQRYNDVYFTGGDLSNVTITNATLVSPSITMSVQTKTTSGDITFTGSYDIVEINKTVSEATTVNITVSSLTANKKYYVIDLKGDCDTYNITLVPSSGTINGESSLVMNNPRACRGFYKTSGGNLAVIV